MRHIDHSGKSALHYAVISNSLVLVKKILHDPDYKIDVNHVDKDGHSALTLSVKGQKSFGFLYRLTAFK